MSATVNHVERAGQLLGWIDSDEGRFALAANPQSGVIATAAAQVHATLALVEQQRIANMLAVAESGTQLGQGAIEHITKGLGLS